MKAEAKEHLKAWEEEIERLRCERADYKNAAEDAVKICAFKDTTIDEKEKKIDRLEEALRRIDDWSRAYPFKIFLEPDLKKAAEVLEANGMTLDAISADAMRHVVEGVGEIARVALERESEGGECSGLA